MQKKLTKSEIGILACLLLLSLGASVSKILIGFDIDEGYAISMPQRLINGDYLFLDMWEVHQTSSFLPAFCMYIYEKITGGIEGVALYLRIVTTVVHLFMTGLVWKGLQKTDIKWRILLCILYFNFLPKWILSLDFSMQQIYGITGIIYLLYRERQTDKIWYDFVLGLVLAFTVLAYPGMVLLYPFVLVCICMLHPEEKAKGKFYQCMMVTSGCGTAALLFFFYVLSHMSLSRLIEGVPLVFMDGTHQFTAQTKLMAYAKQWMNVGKQIFIFAIPTVFITIIIECVLHKITKPRRDMTIKRSPETVRSRRNIRDGNITDGNITDGNITAKEKGTAKSGRYTEGEAAAENQSNMTRTICSDNKRIRFLVLFLITWTVVTSALVIFANVAGIQMGPFHFQVRYLFFFLISFLLCVMLRKEQHTLFWIIFLLNLTAFAGILFFSNVGPDSSSSYLISGVMGGFFLLHYLLSENVMADRLLWFVCALFVVSLIFCKGYYVRITEYGPSTILKHREQVTQGALKGLYLLPEDYQRYEADHRSIENATENGETLLFLGTEGILNLSAGGAFVSPSTISTPAFNEQWTLYFTMYPEKEPDVIVLAKNTIDDREKFFTQNPFGIWIAQNYDTIHREETDSLCIVRR